MRSIESRPTDAELRVRRFAVAWRNRVTPQIHHIGALDHDGLSYRFQYLRGVTEAASGFRPFVGFPDVNKVYRSERLWPFFDLRVMDRKRPDFPQYMRWLGLSDTAGRLDVLSRSGGEQIGDTVLLAEEPRRLVSGHAESITLVRGVSRAVRAYESIVAADGLVPGDTLTILDDLGNEANPNALLLAAPGGRPVGWVPDLLIDYVRQIRHHGGAATLVQNNGVGAPWHARLLVRFAGPVPNSWTAFSNRSWPSLVAPMV